MKEKITTSFEVSYTYQEKNTVALVQVINMDGWNLYECYIHPTLDVVHIVYNPQYNNYDFLDEGDEYLEDHSILIAEQLYEHQNLIL